MDEQMVNELFTPHNWENYTDYARSIFIAIHEEQLESGKEFVAASDVIRRALSRIGDGLSKSARKRLNSTPESAMWTCRTFTKSCWDLLAIRANSR